MMGAGEGSDMGAQRSSKKSLREDHFLLQMPDHLAPLLREASEDEVAVDFLGAEVDGAQDATVRIKERVLPARLMRLPTLVESHKSLDGSLYYKCGMIHQVIDEIIDEIID